jgi:ribosomal protein S1
MNKVTLNKVIKDFSLLPLDDKEYAVDIIERQLIEAKREAIAKRAKRAMLNLRKGAVRKGSVKELYKDLELD